jgi:hypothetical protein
VANRFEDVEEILDRHARRLVQELGGLFADMGEALRRAAEPGEPPPRFRGRSEPTKEDLYREAARLGVRGRSKMTKQELREAIERFRG